MRMEKLSNNWFTQLIEFLGSFLRRCICSILSAGCLPKHVAFIMDGNRRYAKKKALVDGAGHRVGFLALMNMLKYCYELNVKYVTIYAFSIENFKRRPEEVQSTMQLILEKIEALLEKESIVNQYGVRVHFIGNLKLLTEPIRQAAERAMNATAHNSNAVLSICIAYTSTDEIAHSVEEACKEKDDEFRDLDMSGAGYGLVGLGGTASNSSEPLIGVADIEKHMYMAVAPDPDIIIRSSGETRLSNFLLWQSASSLLYSPRVLWPEIGFWHLVRAILDFQRNQAYFPTQLPNTTAETDFLWTPGSPTTCATYAAYRVRSPYSDLVTISHLFGVSSMYIATATNLTSMDAPLIPDQLLLVPINCTSNGTHYFSNVTYQMKKDDSFYTVSTKSFQNLTNIRVVEDTNPALDPSNLTIGVEVVFPLLCKCADDSLWKNGLQYLVTYVWQPGDDVISVSNMFQASENDVVMINNNRNFTTAICLPVLIPVKEPVILQSFFSYDASSSQSKPHWILIAVLSIIMALFLVSSSLAVYFRLLSKRNEALARRSSYLQTSGFLPAIKASKDQPLQPKAFQDKLLAGVSGYLCKPIIYDLDEVMKATSNLSERSRIGTSVYRAVLNGQEVAVKKTRDANEELQILQRVNHSNLVKLMGVSSDDDGSFFIVYEYVENGSLDSWLFPKVSSFSAAVEPLSWKQRLLIALDVANGLHYMHEHTQPSIVHKDISTRNILLDSSFKAKISNFSAARPAACSVILKVDVFCFGVVLLELLSGRKVMETKDNGEVVMLWIEISGILEGGDGREERLRRWMDPKLKSCFSIEDALSLATMAKACTSEVSSERPTMAEVVFSLSVIVQPSPLMYERSWVSIFETEEIYPVIAPVKAR